MDARQNRQPHLRGCLPPGGIHAGAGQSQLLVGAVYQTAAVSLATLNSPFVTVLPGARNAGGDKSEAERADEALAQQLFRAAQARQKEAEHLNEHAHYSDVAYTGAHASVRKPRRSDHGTQGLRHTIKLTQKDNALHIVKRTSTNAAAQLKASGSIAMSWTITIDECRF